MYFDNNVLLLSFLLDAAGLIPPYQRYREGGMGGGREGKKEREKFSYSINNPSNHTLSVHSLIY